MIGYYDNDPLLELHDVLVNEFSELKKNLIDKVITNQVGIIEDTLLRYILLNNGCRLSVNTTYRKVKLKSTDKYDIYFMYGAIGNKANEFFDYIEFYGMKYLVVFMDYFKGLFIKEKSDDEVTNNLQDLMGNSIYADAIRKIVDTYLATTISMSEIASPSLSTTAAASRYRFASTIIAANIIDTFVGLKEDDISYMKYEEIMELIGDNFKISILGIRKVE